jgi:REP element-mobilizing transposase RayT
MPCYLFTFHAYRSWSADNPHGFVQEGKEGVQAPSPQLGRFYDEHAHQPPVLFGGLHQQVLIWIVYDACGRRPWRLHFVATEPTHVHILASWRSADPWRNVRKRLKNLAGLMLGKKCERTGRKWFSRKGSRKRVRDRRHFDYLVSEYLPKHRGLQWREGDPPPAEPLPRSDQ